MKSSKVLILVFTLSFPVILYLFLTYYGSNEFDLPVFFKSENEFCSDFKPITELDDDLVGSDKQTQQLGEVLKGSISVVLFPDLNKENQQLKNELNRLLLTFSSEENVKIKAFYKEKSEPFSTYLMESSRSDLMNYELDSALYNQLIDCHIMLPTQKWEDRHPADIVLEEYQSLVLIDENGRIRGYYNGMETKDVDRLILEIRILMTK